MRHENCDWAIAGECDYCGHRTNPDNMLVSHGHEFCDEECKAAWVDADAKRKCGYVVVGVRHFANGEHHWVAPKYDEEAVGCADEGEVTEMGTHRKPVFSSLADAERYAMSFAHGECTLAQWETRRPTWYVVEAQAFVAVAERAEYILPSGAEEWGDAKWDDYVRECDCEDIKGYALWDSDTDEERRPEKTAQQAG